MATRSLEVDLSGIDDPQRPVAFVVGILLVVVGVAGLTGLLDTGVVQGLLDIDVGLGSGLVLGYFGVPFWLGVTAVVAGLLGIALSFFEGAGTTFNKLAAGLVLPIVLLLAIVDWALAAGSPVIVGLSVIALVVALVLVAVGELLLYGHLLALVLPVVALLTVVDWVFGLTALAPAGESVTLPTIGLLAALAVVVGLVAFEGGRRTTRFE
jgi:hypothetical protein